MTTTAHHHHDHDHHDHHTHTHGHGHGHGHHHGGHSHAPTSFGGTFLIAILLNSAYLIGEAGWGFAAHSLSLLADAGHNLSDVLSLLAAWGAQALARRSPSERFTYGFKRATILTALLNATILLLVTGGIIWEAIWHFIHPEIVHGRTISIVAAIGILINGGTALLLMRGAHHDLNMRGAFLHMASDALMALGVVIAGGLITLTGSSFIDPLASLIVSGLIIWGTWSLLTHALGLALDAVPHSITPRAVEDALRAMPAIADLHHLHIWPISTTETALTVHLTLHPFPEGYSAQDAQSQIAATLHEATHLLQERFAIGHPTFQVEAATATACSAPHCTPEAHHTSTTTTD
ncbi:cation diffusion facilitator family transporter [Bombella pollinis]|uniref:Cation diffusion facilitator family transporter n=1 Tax=Bombella pollinis TaxID=2967337 RepID=A0ABT3WKB4_9PROT|nr:cation diffusion facilitator family transporter [Bombella pollinis]MCX5619539.1 cation diffusion facilitator family transporter [Bombella pollinis]